MIKQQLPQNCGVQTKETLPPNCGEQKKKKKKETLPPNCGEHLPPSLSGRQPHTENSYGGLCWAVAQTEHKPKQITKFKKGKEKYTKNSLV